MAKDYKSHPLFTEYLDPRLGDPDYDQYFDQANRESAKSRRARRRKADEFNEVGVVPAPPPEILERRRIYDNHPDGYIRSEGGLYIPGVSADPDDLVVPHHYVHAHRDLFVNSTGLKPLGPSQIDSTHHSQIVIQHGGRIVKAEPRGFGKTSRTCNESNLGVFQGYISYGLIICSTIEKAEEIILSIITELLENEELEKLYPQEIACFKHLEANPRKAEMQTYNGEFTHIQLKAGLIRFPVIPGSPCSSAIINIRTKKNVRGIYFTDRAGAYAGKRRRPTHVFMDDIQTDEEANNEKTATKLVNLIKRSILRSGGHAKRLSAIMTCTPIAPQDVSHHFLLKEPWQHVIYKMLETRSEREDLWFGEYQERLTSFDKHIPGSQIRAALRALQFYKDNREEMDRGALANWEWCYEYEDDPQLEISAIQHAYNIMILEGLDVFESECQCNIMAMGDIADITYCTQELICSRISHLQRRVLAVEDIYIVTHIDIGFDYLTYVTMSSPRNFKGHIIDYGTYPDYPHRFAKGKVARTLRTLYPEIPIPEDRITKALIDLTNMLSQRIYLREDKIPFKNNLILADEAHFTPYVHKAIRMSPFSIVRPMHGTSIKAKEKGIEEKHYPVGSLKHHHCVEIRTPDQTMMKTISDVNHFKCTVHIGFSRDPVEEGSICSFVEEFPHQHALIGEHCTAEIPSWDIDEKTDKRVVVWTQREPNNEFFDNIVGCLTGFSMLGVRYDIQKTTHREPIDINEYFARHA